MACGFYRTILKVSSAAASKATSSARPRPVELPSSWPRYDIKKQWVIIAGDFNDTPGSAPLNPLLNNSGLFDTLAVANVSADQRWTYYFGKYILVYPKFKLFDKVYNSLSNADKIIVESPD